VAVLAGHTNWVTRATFGPDGRRVLTAGRDGTARLWTDGSISIPTGVAPVQYRLYRSDISPDGRRVAAPAEDNRAQVWDVESGKVVAVLAGHANGVNAVAFDRDSRRVVTASSDGTARVWDAATGRQLSVFSGHGKPVARAAFSPDGTRVVTSDTENSARIWSAETGAQLAVLSGHTGAIVKLAFSPDGKRIVSASPFDGTVRLWETETGKPAGPGILMRTDAWAAAFSPDGRRIVVTAISVTVIDAETGDTVAAYPSLGERVIDATYSPDGRFLLLASLDGTARIWNAEDGRPISVLTGHADGVYTVAMSADGRRLFTASGGQIMRVSPMGLNAADLIADLRPAVPRCLTTAERSSLNLSSMPPAWCFDMDKWPYGSRAWKIWRAHKDDSEAPPLPDSSEWFPWITKMGYSRPERAGDSLIYLEEAGGMLRRLSLNNPGNPRWRRLLALNEMLRGRALHSLRRSSEALAVFERSRDLFVQAVAAEPDNTAQMADLAHVHEQIADALLPTQRRPEGWTQLRAAYALREKLVVAQPGDATRQSQFAFVKSRFAEELLADGNVSAALSNARDNVAMQRKLIAANPGPRREEELALGLRLLGDVLRANKNRVEAIAAYRESVAIRQKLASAEPNDVDRQNAVAFSYDRLARELLANNNTAEAVANYRLALAARQKLAAAATDDNRRDKDLVDAHTALARALFTLGSQSEALNNFRQALAVQERIAVRAEREEVASKGKPGSATAASLGSLAWYALLARDFEKALAGSRRAAELAPELIWVQTNLAHALMFLNRNDDARATYLKYRGKRTFPTTTWEESVLEDFAILRRAGLNHPTMGPVEKLLGGRR
jgi:tetratricopeptide (TPR) repeat protein